MSIRSFVSPRALRLALGLTFAALCSVSFAEAQIVAVFLKDEKAVKKYEDRVVTVNGRPAVLGEPKTGISVAGNSITRDPNVMMELWVADPDDPSVPAYGPDRKGEISATSKKTILRIDNSHVPQQDYATVVMRDDTLPALSREYVLRQQTITDYKAERDAHDRTSNEWAAHHARVVSAMEGLQRWLASTLWPKFAEKYSKEIGKEAKAHKGAAVRLRHDKAVGSLRTIDPPETLVRLSQEISGGKDKFLARETQHLRFIFLDKVSANAVEAALIVGEEAIEGFRAQLVDPWVGDEYPDRIPEGVFQEFLIVPAEADAYMAYTKGFYQVSWDQNREERLKMSGGRSDGSFRSTYKSWWKYSDQFDLEGIVCHQLGHALAGLHYGADGRINQDWLSEALGYHLSFEFLGRNTVSCKSFDRDRLGYDKVERKVEGAKAMGEGRRDLYNEVALAKGGPIDQIARKNLFQLDDVDLAKSWSFYDYIVRKEGLPGQLWLRAAGKHSHDSAKFLEAWRADAARILGVNPAEAFRALETRWKVYAKSEQLEAR
jgi:hypothetical protein